MDIYFIIGAGAAILIGIGLYFLGRKRRNESNDDIYPMW